MFFSQLVAVMAGTYHSVKKSPSSAFQPVKFSHTCQAIWQSK